jgi:L-aspartate oxidase
MGGVTVDLEGRTTVPNLWAAGELTSSGLHGANRLASNSLVEALVYGAHAGENAARAAAEVGDDFAASVIENPRVQTPAEPLNLADIRNSLQSLMWRNMGVQRDANGLDEAMESIDHWRGYVLPRQLADPAGWELQNMLCSARLMIEAARQRDESRGVHVRLDFPQTDDTHWQRHIAFRREDKTNGP